jgi:penicillin-binding protein 2
MNRDRAAEFQSGRGRIFSIAILAVLGLLMTRLVQLQLIDTKEYTGESRTNSTREMRILPARGTIMDRNGLVLVDNQPAYSVLVTPRYFDEGRRPELASLLEMPEDELAERVEQAAKYSAYLPSPVMNAVPFDRLSRMLEQIDNLPGVSYQATQKRRYPTPIRASHALGYVREISDRDLNIKRDDGYRPGDLYGQRGLERIFEADLRGQVGADFKLVNVHGQRVSDFRGGVEDVAATAGSHLRLTIDADLQALAERLFVGKRGGAVALDPNTGEILSLVSAPDFDLEQFTRQISGEQWRNLNEHPDKPFFNRATQAAGMPGSTWKPLMALIALQAGVVTPTETFYCPGYHPMGRGRFFRCLHVHGQVNIMEAIQESCNTFFFEMMRRLNVETYAGYAREFGFDRRIDTDLSEQVPGLIPDSAYYNAVEKAGWGVGHLMSMGVGQGPLLVTPMQLARYTAALANGGELVTPHLVRQLENQGSPGENSVEVAEPSRIPIETSHFGLVREAMRRVMVSGTGVGVQIPEISSGGKTGTAQNPRGEDDSVFILFAPFENPQIAIAVVVENAGYGGSAAGPIASLIAEQYLTGEVTRPYWVNRMLALKSPPLAEPDEG